MRREGGRWGGVAALALAAALCAIPATVRLVPPSFTVERAFACRTPIGEVPGEVTEEFAAGEGVAYVWFEGPPAARETAVHAAVDRDGHPVAAYELRVPRQSNGGVLSLRLLDRPVLPTGSYRVILSIPQQPRMTVWFRVVPGRAPHPAVTAGERIERLAEGYALVARPGWDMLPRSHGGLLLMRRGVPSAGMLVVTDATSGSVDAHSFTAHLAQTFEKKAEFRVVSTSAREIQGRPATTVVLDLSDGNRQKYVVIEREKVGNRTTVHALVLSAALDAFSTAEADFDAMVESFRMGPRIAP